MRNKIRNTNFNRIFYICILVFSAAFLFFGNRVASRGPELSLVTFEPPLHSAVVTEVGERLETTAPWGWGQDITNVHISFDARITGGDLRDEIVPAAFSVSSIFEIAVKEVEVGDRVLLRYNEAQNTFFFIDYERIYHVVVLGALLFLLIVLFGRKKGFNSIIALGFTCMAIFLVFVPAILSGLNIYVTAAIVSVYSIASTLFIVIGPNKKALCAMLGCFGGVLLAGALMLFMDNILHLTGFVDQETTSLLSLPTPNPIDLRAIIFAGVIIGSAGAIMDVAMSISSSLWEVKQAGGVSDFKSIFKSGTEIGKDILGTMLNTLILAYIGSSLSVILLITAFSTSMLELFNREMIIVEFLRAIVGSFGMFLTIPLTAAVCGWLYTGQVHKHLRG